MTCLAWNTTPSLAALCRAIEQHTAPLYLIVCLPENHIPNFPLSNHPSELEGRLNNRLPQAVKCLQFNSVNVLENLLPDVHLWLVPPHRADRLHEHFHHIEWQTEAIPQSAPTPLKPWFRRPEHQIYLNTLNEAERNDIQTYEGNAHSLRIVASLEMYPEAGGMRLTAAAIGALLKYPWTTQHPNGRKKFNIYQTELPFIRQVADELGLVSAGVDSWARHPLSYLMEAADDICYALLDLEDAVELDLLTDTEVESILSELTFAESAWHASSSRQRCAMLRGIAIGKAIDDVAQTFMLHQSDLLDGTFKGKDLLALCSPQVQNTLAKAKELAQTRIFRHHTKLLTEIATFPCLGSILDLLVPAAYALIAEKQLATRQSLALELLKKHNPILPEDSLYQAYMKILDFVGGMTDNSAAKMAQDLSGVGILR